TPRPCDAGTTPRPTTGQPPWYPAGVAPRALPCSARQSSPTSGPAAAAGHRFGRSPPPSGSARPPSGGHYQQPSLHQNRTTPPAPTTPAVTTTHAVTTAMT